MFLFSFLSNLFKRINVREIYSHVRAMFTKIRSTDQDVQMMRARYAELRHIETLHPVNVSEAKLAVIAPQKYQEKRVTKAQKDALMFDRDKKRKEMEERIDRIRKRIGVRKGGARERWVGGR